MSTDDTAADREPGGTPAAHGTGGHYEIRVRGHLGAHWAAWFDGLSLTRGEDGTTTIQGPIPDQAALHGVLRTLRDLGLPLVSLNPLPDDPSPALGADGTKGP